MLTYALHSHPLSHLLGSIGEKLKLLYDLKTVPELALPVTHKTGKMASYTPSRGG